MQEKKGVLSFSLVSDKNSRSLAIEDVAEGLQAKAFRLIEVCRSIGVWFAFAESRPEKWFDYHQIARETNYPPAEILSVLEYLQTKQLVQARYEFRCPLSQSPLAIYKDLAEFPKYLECPNHPLENHIHLLGACEVIIRFAWADDELLTKAFNQNLSRVKVYHYRRLSETVNRLVIKIYHPQSSEFQASIYADYFPRTGTCFIGVDAVEELAVRQTGVTAAEIEEGIAQGWLPID